MRKFPKLQLKFLKPIPMIEMKEYRYFKNFYQEIKNMIESKERIHSEMIYFGFKELYKYNEIEETKKVYELIENNINRIEIYELIINIFLRNEKYQDIIKIYEKMKKKRMKMNSIIIKSYIKSKYEINSISNKIIEEIKYENEKKVYSTSIIYYYFLSEDEDRILKLLERDNLDQEIYQEILIGFIKIYNYSKCKEIIKRMNNKIEKHIYQFISKKLILKWDQELVDLLKINLKDKYYLLKLSFIKKDYYEIDHYLTIHSKDLNFYKYLLFLFIEFKLYYRSLQYIDIIPFKNNYLLNNLILFIYYKLNFIKISFQFYYQLKSKNLLIPLSDIILFKLYLKDLDFYQAFECIQYKRNSFSPLNYKFLFIYASLLLSHHLFHRFHYLLYFMDKYYSENHVNKIKFLYNEVEK